MLGLIKVSLEFMLSFTYDGGRDKAYGRATLTVKVEIAFFSASVDITVETRLRRHERRPDVRPALRRRRDVERVRGGVRLTAAGDA